MRRGRRRRGLLLLLAAHYIHFRSLALLPRPASTKQGHRHSSFFYHGISLTLSFHCSCFPLPNGAITAADRRVYTPVISWTWPGMPWSSEHKRIMPGSTQPFVSQVSFPRTHIQEHVDSFCVSGAILDSDLTEALCIDTCRTSLSDARATIVAACMDSKDNITYDDVAYPGMIFWSSM